MKKKEFQSEITKKGEQSDLKEKLKENPIILIEEKSKITIEELKTKFPSQLIIACDFYVEDIEKGIKKENSFEKDGIINIDHHIPVKEMERYISSTNLAIDYVKKNGIIKGENKIIVINHVDCDSVLASGILRGLFLPEEKFGEAAIAADHTGVENKIANLLQALQEKRDLEFSLRNLQLFLENKDLEPETIVLLKKRLNERKRAEELVKKGKFNKQGLVNYAILEDEMDAALFPSLLPNAQVIMIANPLKIDQEKQKRWIIKLRLGINPIKGFKLDKKIITEKLDSNYGGRWNAGSNKRALDGIKIHSGTDIDPREYAIKLNEILKDEILKLKEEQKFK